MKIIFYLVLLLFISSCNKARTVFICGDHECVNKTEAKQYFEENLTIEVKILDSIEEKNFDLVELNLNKKNQKSKREVTLLSKKKTNNDLRTLSKKEIVKIKKNIKNKKHENKIARTNIKKNDFKKNKEKVKKEELINNNVKKRINVNKNKKKVVDVCTILEKCSIDEISKYLLKQGEKKGFPDINSSQ